MRDEELEKKIHDCIIKLYNAKYTGRLEVIKNVGYYTLILGIPSYMLPTHIGLQTDDPEEFLSYVEEQLRESNFMRVYFYKIIRRDAKRTEI